MRKAWIPILFALVFVTASSCRPSTQRDVTAPSPASMKTAADRLPGTVVTTVLGEKIDGKRNVLWCATAPLAWNELCRLAGGEVQVQDGPPWVAELNQRAVGASDLDAASYLAMAGIVRDGILEKLAKAMAEKFGEKATPELLPAPGSLPPDFWVTYAYLLKQLPFEWAFTRFDDPRHQFAGTPVVSFGIDQYLPGEQPNEARMAKQVSIFDFRSQDDFIIELVTRSKEDRLLLAKVPPAATLAETIAAVRARVAASKAEPMEEMADLRVPVLDFDLTKSYGELEGHKLIAKDPRVNGTTVAVARQRVRFRLDEKGAVLESEMIGAGGLCEKNLIFDKPFLVLLERKGAKNPYFALWVANAELLLPAEKEPAPAAE